MKLKGVESTVFGAKERRVSWSQTQIPNWEMKTLTETQNTEGGAGTGKGRRVMDVFSLRLQKNIVRVVLSGDVCWCDFGWNSIESSRLEREIEELIAYRLCEATGI